MSFYTYVINGSEYEIESKMFEKEDVVNECAEDYYNNQDGWESKWPLTLELFNLNKTKSYGKFKVNFEAEPTFYSNRI